MHIYDIAVVGGGAAGCMAAIRAAQLGKDAALIERNASVCKKILLTGKGRCNVTNSAPPEAFIEKFGKEGPFLRSAFFNFFNEDLAEFFKSAGLALKTERQGRVFPATDESRSVAEVLKKRLEDNKVRIFYNTRLRDASGKGPVFHLVLEDGGGIRSRKLILATGGVSYKATGSTGDGFGIARKLGHSVTPLKPALVPLKTKESWVKHARGLSLKNVRISFGFRKKTVSDIGELIFTHFGVSGPLILDLSGEAVSFLRAHKEAPLFIDLKPGLEPEQLDKRLLREFGGSGSAQLKNVMKNLLPRRLIPPCIRLAGLDGAKKANQITQKERRSLVNLLKTFPLTIIGSLPVEEAMVTNGGVSTKEINPKTMESKIVPGLYFAGEIIDGCAPSGGYNLQQAFSTGYLAGEKAALCAK